MFAGFIAAVCLASAGDRDPAYASCVRECATPQACADWTPDLALALFGWTCTADCRYHCMWRISSMRESLGTSVLQYHGKWPFVRLLGMQEPASVLFSIGNGVAHANGLRHAWPLSAHAARGFAWRAFGLIAINAWLWASVFHCRDVYWTQCADYFSATLLIGGATLNAAHHLLAEFGSALHSWTMPPLLLAALAAYVDHVLRMRAHFDYGLHLRINVGLGTVHLVLWLLWWARTRHERPHAWRAPAINALLAASLVFELRDAPPLGGLLDGHAMWHLSSIPTAAAFWRLFVHAELRHTSSTASAPKSK